jgi:hypothetical protein
MLEKVALFVIMDQELKRFLKLIKTLKILLIHTMVMGDLKQLVNMLIMPLLTHNVFSAN